MNSLTNFFIEKADYKIANRAKLVKWVSEVIAYYEKLGGAINFVLTDDKGLHEINLKYLNTDTYTDVISFNLSDEENIISGDIFISIDRVKENSIKYNVSIEEELKRVLVHGLLHLIGLDDTTTDQKANMKKFENLFLKRFNS